MSQQENNEIKSQIDTMLSGMNGMVGCLDKMIGNMKKSLTPDQAMEFAKQMKESNLEETLEKYKKVSKDLKSELNID